MISRREIIRSQQEQSAFSSSQNSASATQNSKLQKAERQYQQQMRGASGGQQRQTAASRASTSKENDQQLQLKLQLQQQNQDSSDGYVATSSNNHHQASSDDYWNENMHHESSKSYRHFDPYSIDSEEEDVWYSEERLFEDHLEEIFNKWRLLDDDIWCKLIIMERNRRIGKAYARVPMITIDGSHQLSYDGFKLALNGFDNPDRDAKTEECRKRIGEGIRIKMDDLGNILIKRRSKAEVYIKEWIPSSSSGSSSSNGGRSMPSRQQLIKNQNAMLAAMNNAGAVGNGRTRLGGSQVSSLNTSITPCSSSSGSSMDPPNDSAICDEVISVGGLLEQNKIYVMFDMKKFQSNITQELCRPYPDKRKLEQQCFSIVSLARNSDEILNLPCWVMVINIVAIEILNERFPLMNNHFHHSIHHGNSFPDTMLLENTRRNNAPNFVSIFEQNNNNGNSNNNERLNKDDNSKEEDPYSLPANASSSDVKSSVHDYGTASTKNISVTGLHGGNGYPISSSRNYGVNSKRSHTKNPYLQRADLSRNNNSESMMLDNMKHRSKSNCNIYGPSSKSTKDLNRYTNSSSIYSPGHMLVPPTNNLVPPKLPPRDFVKKGKSKSSSNISHDDTTSSSIKMMDPNNESIYSTGLHQSQENQLENGKQQLRKTKKNRSFLESLKAPLELAKSSGRSASVISASFQQQPTADSSTVISEQLDESSKKSSTKTKGFSKSSAKNIKSFLGVKGSSKTKETNSDVNSTYVHVDEDKLVKNSTNFRDNIAEVDSVVDSNEEVDESQQIITTSSSSASYNDLDIPTPDYETDENIYALEESHYGRGGFSVGQENEKNDNGRRSGVNSKSKSSKSHNKEDLYYSGFRAHVPQNITTPNGGCNGVNGARSASKSVLDDKMSSGNRVSRIGIHNKMLGSRFNTRELIYGSNTGITPMSGSRYRSASMQRYYTRSQAAAKSQSEMYDLEIENPYAMSGGIDVGIEADNQGHYGITGHRRRSSSKVSNPYHGMLTGVGGITGGVMSRVTSSMANSNYDIGRSSSGIYGNNSSSSSSDYAGWHPQMRKVNSSGYLNSIFKNHIASPVDPYSTNPLSNNNSSNSNPVDLVHGYNNSSKQQQQQQQRNHVSSRTLKSSRPTSKLSKQQQQQQLKQQQQATSIVTGPSYRSYDSSNDSEPSYTNSSDGLDIYDHIGAHARLNHHHHHQFLDMPAPNNTQAEVHIGEWENMYNR